MNQTVNYYAVVQAVNSTTGNYETTWPTLTGSTKGFLFEGSAAERVIGEKLRPDVDAVIIVDPNTMSFTPADTGKVIIGTRSFYIVRVENIGEQGEVMQLQCKEDV